MGSHPQIATFRKLCPPESPKSLKWGEIALVNHLLHLTPPMPGQLLRHQSPRPPPLLQRPNRNKPERLRTISASRVLYVP